MPTDNFLAQVADLDRRARAAGMPGVMPDGYEFRKPGDALAFLPQHEEHRDLYCGPDWIPDEAATAAVTHWLREFLDRHMRNDRGTPEQLIEWATDRITLAEEARNASSPEQKIIEALADLEQTLRRGEHLGAHYKITERRIDDANPA